MVEIHITYMGLKKFFEQEGMIFVSDIGPLFGHWVPMLSILEMTYNNKDGTYNITVSEETAKRLTFKRK